MRTRWATGSRGWRTASDPLLDVLVLRLMALVVREQAERIVVSHVEEEELTVRMTSSMKRSRTAGQASARC